MPRIDTPSSSRPMIVHLAIAALLLAVGCGTQETAQSTGEATPVTPSDAATLPDTTVPGTPTPGTPGSNAGSADPAAADVGATEGTGEMVDGTSANEPERLTPRPQITSAEDIVFDMPSVGRPFEGVTTGGQPTPADLERLASEGFKTVVNLRTQDEDGLVDEKDRVEALGMRYVSLPVAGGEDLDETNALMLHGLLQDRDARPMLLHCASSNRVGALVALAAFYGDDLSPADAMARGIAAGLDRLGTTVNQKMQAESQPSGPPNH